MAITPLQPTRWGSGAEGGQAAPQVAPGVRAVGGGPCSLTWAFWREGWSAFAIGPAGAERGPRAQGRLFSVRWAAPCPLELCRNAQQCAAAGLGGHKAPHSTPGARMRHAAAWGHEARQLGTAGHGAGLLGPPVQRPRPEDAVSWPCDASQPPNPTPSHHRRWGGHRPGPWCRAAPNKALNSQELV